MGLETSNGLKWSLRVLSAISFAIGMGFVIWACVIQSPPKSALPLGLIILGTFGMILAIVGFFHSMCARCCLSVFLLCMGLLTIGELAIVITQFANLDGTVENLMNYQIEQDAANARDSASEAVSTATSNKDGGASRRLLAAVTASPSPPSATSSYTAEQLADKESLTSTLETGRYVFLVFVLLQFVALLVAIVMRVRFPYKDSPEEFEEHQAARSAVAQIQMESLKSSVGRSKHMTSPAPDQSNFYTGNKKMQKSVTRKMSQKYGEFTQDPAFQRKWWQKMPGM